MGWRNSQCGHHNRTGMEYTELENRIRAEAEAVDREEREWPASEVAGKLRQIADLLERIRHQHQTGIDASLGKRSGRKLDDIF